MRGLSFLGLMLLLVGCQGETGDVGESYQTTVLDDFEVLVDFESQKLMQPGRLIFSEGEIFISDFGTISIKVFDPEGNELREFGGEGDGPGEFRAATNMSVDGDYFYVYDRPNERFVQFDRQGAFVDNYVHDYESIFITTHTVINDQLVSTTGGAGGSLVAGFDKNGEKLYEFGESVAETQGDDMGGIMQDAMSQIESREIPDVNKNSAFTTSSSRDVWLAMMAVPEIYRLDPESGEWNAFEVEVERMEQIEEEFFDAMDQMEQQALIILSYFSEVAATDEYFYGLTTLRDEEEPAVVYQINREGETVNRYELSAHTGNRYSLTVSDDDSMLFLTNTNDAELIKYEL